MNASRSASGSAARAAPISEHAASNISAPIHLLRLVMMSPNCCGGLPHFPGPGVRLFAGSRHDGVPAVASRLHRRDPELVAPDVHRFVPAVLPPDAHERPRAPGDVDAGAHEVDGLLKSLRLLEGERHR